MVNRLAAAELPRIGKVAEISQNQAPSPHRVASVDSTPERGKRSIVATGTLQHFRGLLTLMYVDGAGPQALSHGRAGSFFHPCGGRSSVG